MSSYCKSLCTAAAPTVHVCLSAVRFGIFDFVVAGSAADPFMVFAMLPKASLHA